ncbi:MAG: hypothetical protein QF898_03735, partial [SAR202 cluster bacterium]|nr:hypothetical protein [SAR202 cluster bacterium]
MRSLDVDPSPKFQSQEVGYPADVSVNWTFSGASPVVVELGVKSVRGGCSGIRSNAPMSLAEPCGRATPRWSVFGAVLSSPASIAGLPDFSACVSVGPPLSCKG